MVGLVGSSRINAIITVVLSLFVVSEVAAFSTSPLTMGTMRYSSFVFDPQSTCPIRISARRPLKNTSCWGSSNGADDDAKNVSRWRPSFPRNRKNIAAVAAVVAAVAISFPIVSHADVSGITGSATEIASSTSSLVESLAQTGFWQAFSLVFLSEIGDKTFFIAGLLAAKTSKFVSFVGSMAALTVMTILSVGIGQVFHAVPSGLGQGLPIDDIAAVLAFAFFGLKTLKDAIEMDPDESVMDEELADAQEAVDGSDTSKQETPWAQLASIFGLVFAAEFGDRSFLSTIALSAAQNPFSVATGAIAAHAVATGIAVSGGSFVAKYLSEKVIGYVGGTLFLVFAATTALGIF